MFLSRRSMQAEYFDSDRPAAELIEFFQSLQRLNKLFAFGEPFQRLIPQLLGDSNCVSLSVLDLGAGDGSLGRVLIDWAVGRGWSWRIANLDSNFQALTLNRDGRNVTGSALALPFRAGAFDLVVASQMTHHLADGEVKQLFREAWRVARQGIVVCDLHRNPALYALLWLLFRCQRYPESFCADAILSVRRSWHVGEIRKLARESGIAGAEARLYFWARIVLLAKKHEE